MAKTTLLAIGAVLVVGACQGQSPSIGSLGQAVAAAPVGNPCMPGDQRWAQHTGYNVGEVNIEDNFEGCSSGVCLVNHFQGGVNCPYGQTDEQARTAPACFVPYSTEPVMVPVQPQLIARRADVTVICSCRCAGPGSGPFCDCPAGMECVEILKPSGLLSSERYEGSYCIVQGTAFDDDAAVPSATCQNPPVDCGDPRPY
jgi:hypothetical protein